MALLFANNNSLSEITALPSSISGGGMTLISEQTASGSATLDFTSGIDSTYDSYVFKFINIHPSIDGAQFLFNMSTDGGSNYNVTKTTTVFRSIHTETDAIALISYRTATDLAQSSSYQTINDNIGSDNDQSLSGNLTIYNPSSDTFVKHFLCVNNTSKQDDNLQQLFIAGYGNTTSAVDAVRFQMSSGNIDSGVIKLYGVS